MLGRRIPTGYSCNPLLVCEVKQIEDSKNNLLESIYLAYQWRITGIAYWNPIPHIQIEDSKKSLLESIYLTYQ
jgi:hypothetical protein